MINTGRSKAIRKLIQILLMVGFLLLPFSHLRWLPNLGTTRPLSSFLFAAAAGLIIIMEILANWRRIFSRNVLQYVKEHLESLPGGKRFVPWWLDRKSVV